MIDEHAVWHGIVALSLGLLGVGAAVGLSERWIPRAAAKRTLWRMALLAAVGLLLAEGFGAGALVSWPGDAAVAPAPSREERRLEAPPWRVASGEWRVVEDDVDWFSALLAEEPDLAEAPDNFDSSFTTRPDIDVSWREPTQRRQPPLAARHSPLATGNPPPAPISSSTLGPALALLWTLGAFALLARLLIGRLALWRLSRRLRETGDVRLRGRQAILSRRLRLKRQVRLCLADMPGAPLAFGIVRPTIVAPADFVEAYSAHEQDAALAHELAHLAAHDPAWRLMADLLAAVLWWHPAVWLIRGRMFAASEAAADEASLIVEDGPGVLAELLVALGARRRARSVGWIGMAGGFRSGLGRRVARLLSLQEATYRRPPSGAAAAAYVFGSTAVVVAALCFTSRARFEAPQSGDPQMSAIQRCWRTSLAGAALLMLTGCADATVAAGADDAEDGVLVQLDDDREEREGDREDRDDDDRERGDREEEDRDRPEGDRPGAPRGDRPRGDRDDDRREGARDEVPRDRPRGDREDDRPRDDDREGDRSRERDRPRGDRDRADGERPRFADPARPRRPGFGDRPRAPVGEAERRIHHLMQAAANLEAAGLRDRAAEVRQEAEELRRQHAEERAEGEGDRPRAPGVGEGRTGAARDLIGVIQQLRAELNELRAAVRRLEGYHGRERQRGERAAEDRERQREGAVERDRERDGEREREEGRREREEGGREREEGERER